MRPRSFKLDILHELTDLPELGNVDIVVEFEGGRRFGATVFTVENITYLFQKNAETGERLNGLYLWGNNMIILKRLDRHTIERAIEDLLETGEFESAFERFPDATSEEPEID